ncbi:hypothetical protein BDY21DRAFT_354774 [Lineolata rhizophorae]|uniref:Heterokaryon incompatibility domain-containing protein n=1 Tax=Lineolata rhizophorae TaxID=578093 RepID=A0A6A6NQM7_9PEZI|nr:hypothetical protein BDY21DRAFT_354774 [Lineolata rhizophorae]
MDHLVFGEHDVPIIVPYLLLEDFAYDNEDFHAYPERCGWDFDVWLKHDAMRQGIDINAWLRDGPKKAEELPAFLQSWLFFGLLSACLKTSVDTNDFVRLDESSGSKVITTANLDSYLRRYQPQFVGCPTEEKSELLSEFLEIMNTAGKILGLVQLTIDWGDPPFVDALREVHFSCCLIARSLTPVVGVTLGGSVAHSNVGMGRMPLIVQRMQRDGWCPHTVARLTEGLYHDAQAYAYSLGTLRARQDHSKCKTSYCIANQAGEDFVPKHLEPDCDCEHVEAPIDAIVQTLQDGFVPVLSAEISEEDGSSPTFAVSRMDSNTPYIPISHVWADGLGNPKANAIPRCQLESLNAALREIEDKEGKHLPFWLDTLCIPVAKEHQALRDFSIQRMHDIYKDSYGVLVLDPDFAVMSPEAEFWETTNRLLMSGWITRLWTYQEGALPARLYLRVRGGVVEAEEVMDRFRLGRLHLTPVTHALSLSAVSGYANFMPRLPDFQDDKTDVPIQKIIFSLAGRITSRPGDESVCIATSLGLDPSAILACDDPADRMCELLKLLPFIPANVLFSTGRRLTMKGFRWAPETFLQPGGLIGKPVPARIQLNGESHERHLSYLHPDGKGLVTYLPGIRIQELDLSKARWDIAFPNGTSFRAGNYFNESSSTSVMKDIAILLPMPPNEARSKVGWTHQTGVLVGIYGKTRDPSASKLSFKMIRSGGVIGSVFVESQPSLGSLGGQDDEYHAKGEIMEPKWWLLDGV